MQALTKLTFIISLLLISTLSYAQIDLNKELTSKNHSAITSYLSDNTDVNLEGKQAVYSKDQAELLLRTFFSQHPISSFTKSHQGQSKLGIHFLMGKLMLKNMEYKLTLKYTQSKVTSIQYISIQKVN